MSFRKQSQRSGLVLFSSVIGVSDGDVRDERWASAKRQQESHVALQALDRRVAWPGRLTLMLTLTRARSRSPEQMDLRVLY